METYFLGLWKLTRGNLHSPLWLSTISSVVCTDVCVSVCVCVCVCVRVSDCTQFLMLPQFSLEIGFTMSCVPALEPLIIVFVWHREGGREGGNRNNYIGLHKDSERTITWDGLSSFVCSSSSSFTSFKQISSGPGITFSGSPVVNVGIFSPSVYCVEATSVLTGLFGRAFCVCVSFDGCNRVAMS